MRRVTFIGLAALAMAAMAGCSGGSIGEPAGSTNGSGEDTVTGLLLDENSDTVTRGRFVTTDGQISFFVTSDADTRAVRIQFNGKTFDVTVNGSVIVDGHGAVLTAAEKALLLSFSEVVTSRFQNATKNATRFQGLANLGSYLSEAPEGHVHVRLVDGLEIPEGVAASATTTPPIICLVRNTTATASYTDSRGVRTTEPVVVGANWGTSVCGKGDYSCMGLCGAGCSGTNWTQDCLNHDTCSHDKCSTLGPFDANCKDEFNLASDDYNATGTKACPGTAPADAGGGG